MTKKKSVQHQCPQDMWKAAEASARQGDLRSANSLRVMALSQLLATAETAVLTGDAGTGAASLRQLRWFAAQLVEQLEANGAAKPETVRYVA